MKRKGRIYGAAIAAISCFVLLIVASIIQLMRIQEGLGDNTGESMMWMAFQAQSEAQQLGVTLAQTPEVDLAADPVAKGLDLLNSRIDLMLAAPNRPYFAQIGQGAPITAAKQAMDALYDRQDAGGALTEAERQDASAAIAQIGQSMGEVANATLIDQRRLRGDRHDGEAAALHILMVSSLGMLVAGAIMAWQLIDSLRHARRSEQALFRHKAELEETVRQRTADLEQALIFERDAKESYRSFISTVSHQFRTPLSIIYITAQRLALRATEFPAKAVSEKGARITEATRRLLDIVDSVTHVSAVDAGRVQMSMTAEDLNTIVAKAIAGLPDLGYEGRCVFTPAPAPLPTRSDPVLMAQAVLNLLTNAAKYSSPDSEIAVATQAAGNTVQVSVANSGMGIPLADQKHLFERFHRGQNVTHMPGSGLGLNLAKTIVEAHAGTIACRSTPGETTVFTISLPRTSPVNRHSNGTPYRRPKVPPWREGEQARGGVAFHIAQPTRACVF